MKTGYNKHQILFYNYNGELNEDHFQDVTVVNSPATCLQKATRHLYELIVIFQKFRLLNERFALIELCSTLKQSPSAKHVPLLCLLSFKHRGLLEQLQNAGVDYVRFCNHSDTASEESLRLLLAKPSEDCTVDKILAEICPYINYFPISRHQEILYCGAYRNRLVLGPHRLQHCCETIGHKDCHYFKCPIFF